ncbi:MAG: hypothetical protein H0V53_06560 [Rubrobacter sp.]|nr:hypothetical protein [Rubrobacter sp.]
MKDGGGPRQATSLRLAEHVWAVALYSLLAAVFTYPLVSNLDRVNGAGDPAVMVWSMAWISHAVTTDPAALYDANIFHPIENALAYTDLLLPSALFTAPLYLATGNALLGFNVVLLLTFVLSGYAVFLLAHRLLAGSSYASPAALFAGALYTLSPYRFGHITQLNSMTTYLLPLILLFMHRYLEDGRRPRDLFLVGIFFALNALSGLYYGVFALLMMAAFFAVWSLVNREPPRLRDFLYGVPVFALFGGVLALLLGPYLALSGESDHGRSIETVAGGSFVPPALLTSPPESALLGWTPEAFGVTNENGYPMYELTLYPGLVAASLAAYGLLSRNRRPRASALYAGLGAVIFILSCGPYIPVGDLRIPLPYYLIYEYVPGFDSLRVPARMWAIVMLCIAVLAGFGLRALLDRLRGRKAVLALAALSVVAALEFSPTLPVDRFVDRGPPELEPAYAYLAEEAPEDTPVVAEVPFANPGDAFRETPRMYRSTHGWWRLVNGYASYFPEGYDESREALDSLPEPESLEELRSLGVDYVVAHADQYEDDGEDGGEVLRSLEDEPSLERVAGDGTAELYRFEG